VTPGKADRAMLWTVKPARTSGFHRDTVDERRTRGEKKLGREGNWVVGRKRAARNVSQATSDKNMRDKRKEWKNLSKRKERATTKEGEEKEMGRNSSGGFRRKLHKA